MEAPALYVRDGDAYVGTHLTQGGWDPDAANGGAALALLGQCLHDVPTLVPMLLSRFTADLVRPAPIGRRMHVVTEVVREGRKIQVVDLRLVVEGVDHVRATALRLRDVSFAEGAALPPSTTAERPADRLVGPEQASPSRNAHPNVPGFMHSVDMRYAPRTDRTGYGWWIRPEVPVVAGDAVNETARLTMCFDFANLAGVKLGAWDVTMINPDVTAHVLRPRRGEWFAATGETRVSADRGRGVTDAQLSDEDGVFATVSTSQLFQLRRS